nr:ABC transporter permease [uncultured Gellertiella sp.]
MTFFQLARRSAWRKPARTVLLMFSVAVAFVIYALMASFLAGSQGAEGASVNRLVVTNKAGKGQALPLSDLNQITGTKGVAASVYTARMRSFVTNEKNVVVVSAVDPQRMAAVMGEELGLSADMLTALDQARDRVLVGKALAQTQGWTVGQRISVTAFQTGKMDGTRDWNFEIAGIFEGNSAKVDTYFMIGRYDYFNATRARDKDSVDAFVIVPASGVDPGVLAPKIDALFANSAAPTKTQSEKQFLEAFVKQIADVGAIINLVVGAAFVTILMIVINTMAFAVRERTFEIGVLKTLGFSRGRIMGLILSETLFIFVVGGVLGVVVAGILSLFADPSIGLAFTPLVVLKAAAIIVALGILIGLLPAFNAMRMPIVNAFKSR